MSKGDKSNKRISQSKRFRVTAIDVQDKVVADQQFNTELAAKSFAEIQIKTTKIKAVRINGKIYKKAR